MKQRSGFSLIELLVAMALLALIATAASVAIRPASTDPAKWRTVLVDARHRAIRTGTIVVGYHDSVGTFAAHAHGMLVTDSAPHVRFAVDANAK
jgi:prepilin-type N-terminal cleavage/methylation domain-containing protein